MINNKSDEVEEISDYNKNLIAAVTHDLKNPAIAQIRGLELLLNGNFGEISDTQKNFINEILSSAHNMLNMIINMLWLYKFENKKFALNISKLNINEVIKDVFNENKIILNSKNHKFEFEINQNFPFFNADKIQIKRIITNLLINAVFHSCENSVIFIKTDVIENNFIFTIKNFGKFIDEKNLQFIYDINKVFTKESDSLSTGLGLYLSNEMLNINGGKIICKSEKNGTNTFGFSIKL